MKTIGIDEFIDELTAMKKGGLTAMKKGEQKARQGHNSGGIAGDQLKSLLDRIERLEQEKATIAVDIREVFAEAKAHGFDTKTMRRVLKLRKMETSQAQEAAALLGTYLAAVGMEQLTLL